MRGNFLCVVPRRFFANYKWRKEELSDISVTLFEKYDKLLRRKSFSPGGIYILHDHLAEKVVKYLCPHPENETAVVLEANPGPGILTRKILNAGVANLRIFEPQPAFLHELRKLKEEYPRLEIFEENLFELSKITHRDQMMEGNLKTDAFLAGVKQSAWSDLSPLKIVGIPPPRQETIFLRFIIARLGCLSSVFAYGRTQLLIFVSSKEHKTMTATSLSGFALYRPASVFYNIFFDVEVLEAFPRQLFYPPPHARRTDGYLYLVRLTPKINLLEDMGTHQHLQEFCFFVQQNMTKRNCF